MSSLWTGLALALAASVALNTSYVLQHRGSSGAVAITPRRPLATLRSLLGSRWWVVGGATGILGWGLHVGALAHAPLSLVQAFVAGGLALAVPLAAWIAGERIGREETGGVAMLVGALALLSVGLRPGGAGEAVPAGPLALWLAGLGLAAGGLALAARGPRRPVALGLAGGLLYGAADMAIKAVVTAGPVSVWLPAAALLTLGAFFAFQRGLQTGEAVPVIALMTAGTNAGSILGGFLVFGDPLGTTPAAVAAHALGLALVGLGAWRIAPAQARFAVGVADAPAVTVPDPPAAPRGPGAPAGPPPRRRAPRVLGVAVGSLLALAAVAGGTGVLYLERQAGLLGLGPLVGGALPLQQLASGEAQPLLRVLVAFGAAGLGAGLALRALGRAGARLVVALPAAVALLTLLAAGAESDAVASTRHFVPQLAVWAGRPGVWVGTAAVALGAALALVRPPGRRALALAAVAVIALGTAGTYAYGRDYWLYRGFGPARDPAGVSAGAFRTLRFFSPALGQRRKALVYLPPGYRAGAGAGRRYPVLYVLHAAPGRPDTTFKSGAINVRLDELIAAHRVRPMLIVIPYGKSRHFHNDTEWANAAAGPYERFVLDTVHAVDRHFATIAARRGRALAGYSEGGYGAVNVALHNLATFSVAEAWSGYFVQTPTAAFRGAGPALLWRNSPAAYVPGLAPELRRFPLSVFAYLGTHDDVSPVLTRRFASELNAAGGHATVRVYPGRHDWRLWRGHMTAALTYAGRRL
jgi:enterochelin esterase-like enzyme